MPYRCSSPLPWLVAATAVAVVTATPLRLKAEEDAGTLAVRVTDPPSVSFDATALGRATHPLRLVLTNSGKKTAQLQPLAFRFRPVRDGIAFPCDESNVRDDRWPSTLDPGASFTLSREVTCETPLPGRYDVELRGRPRGGPDSAERTYGSFVIQIDPGANPPLKPWEGPLFAAASGTTEMRPSKDPNMPRVVVAMINGSRATATLAPVRASLRVKRRGSTAPPCPERTVDLAFSGPLMPGRSQSLVTPLGCALAAEAVYDVDIAITNASGASVKIATHAIRVGVIPPPPPRPEHAPLGKIIGGM